MLLLYLQQLWYPARDGGSTIPALRNLRQENDHEFKSNLGYIVSYRTPSATDWDSVDR